MVCCVDFPVQTVKLFLSCIIGAGAQNRDRPAYWCTESRSTGKLVNRIAIDWHCYRVNDGKHGSVSGELMLWG